jgi:predicted alpha/beta hydrolase family esterase
MPIFIFHGVGGSPQENWFPWLTRELEKLKQEVIVPQFPTPEGQTLDNWLKTLERYNDKLTPDTILVGHSLGVPFALNIIERHPVKAAFLVAGFTGIAGNIFDEGMKTFAQRDFDWRKIRKNCPRFFVFHSDNDPYIALDKAEELARNLGVEVIMIPGGGHLNRGAGFTEFPLLLETIKAVLE